uniref:Uncharacterized protein n=1 Tax=Anguilla anguilla TaxID=7936 RepID=A0A0E9SDY4_ANGAN
MLKKLINAKSENQLSKTEF